MKLANISSCECETGNPTPAESKIESWPCYAKPDRGQFGAVVLPRSDGDPLKKYLNIDKRIGAVLEHNEPSSGLVRRKEELHSSITVDDDDDDTFAPFTERATGTQSLLGLIKLSDNSELNNRIKLLITDFEP